MEERNLLFHKQKEMEKEKKMYNARFNSEPYEPD